MSTTTLTYPDVCRDRQVPALGRITSPVITDLVLIAVAILIIVIASNRDANRADLIPIAQTSPAVLAVAVPVPTPLTVDVQPIPSETPAPSAAEIGHSVVAVPAPTP